MLAYFPLAYYPLAYALLVVTPVPDAPSGAGEGGKRRTIFKPTGLLARKKTTIDTRVEDAQEVAIELAAQLAKQLSEPTVEIAQMTMAEINFELSVLLHKKHRTNEDDAMLLILLAANL